MDRAASRRDGSIHGIDLWTRVRDPLHLWAAKDGCGIDCRDGVPGPGPRSDSVFQEDVVGLICKLVVGGRLGGRQGSPDGHWKVAQEDGPLDVLVALPGKIPYHE